LKQILLKNIIIYVLISDNEHKNIAFTTTINNDGQTNGGKKCNNANIPNESLIEKEDQNNNTTHDFEDSKYLNW